MYSDVDETKKILNEACIEIAQNATALTVNALEVNSYYYSKSSGKTHFPTCLRLKDDFEEELFFEFYKKASKSLSSLFYNNISPHMIKDSLMVFWNRDQLKETNAIIEILKNHQGILLDLKNTTQEARDYQEVRKLMVEYTRAVEQINKNNEQTSQQVRNLGKALYDQKEKALMPLTILTEGLGDHLLKIVSKVQEISDIQQHVVELTTTTIKTVPEDEATTTLVLSKRERNQGMG